MKNKRQRALLATLSYYVIFTASGVTLAATNAILTYEDLLEGIADILLPVAIGVIGIPLVIINSYKVMVSQGDPQKTRDGKEGLTAAIVGLMFLLFSMTILKLILGSFFGL